MQRADPKVERFYKTKQWRQARQQYIYIRHGRCERCGHGGYIVHHKTYITSQNVDDDNITLNFDNFELLCQACHNAIHMSKVPYAFDENGDLINTGDKGKH